MAEPLRPNNHVLDLFGLSSIQASSEVPKYKGRLFDMQQPLDRSEKD